MKADFKRARVLIWPGLALCWEKLELLQQHGDYQENPVTGENLSWTLAAPSPKPYHPESMETEHTVQVKHLLAY